MGWRRSRRGMVSSASDGVVACCEPGCSQQRVRSMKAVLTTAEVAERKRAQYWQDAVCDTFVELDCEVRANRPFFGELATTQCDGLHFSNVRSEGQIVKRTPHAHPPRARRGHADQLAGERRRVWSRRTAAKQGSSPATLPATTARGHIRCALTPNSSSLCCTCRAMRWSGGSAEPKRGRRGGSRPRARSDRWCCRSFAGPPLLCRTLRRRRRAGFRKPVCHW